MAVQESFDASGGKLPVGWRVAAGHWSVVDGALTVDALGGEAMILFGEPSWQNYEIEVSATFLEVRDPARWLSIVFRAPADGSPPWSQFPVRFQATADNGTEFAVRLSPRQWRVRRQAKAGADSELGRPRKLRAVVLGSHVHCYLDGRPVIESYYCVERNAGCVGLGANGCRATFDDFAVRPLPNTTPEKRTSPTPPEIVAHRGYSGVAPENTLAAVTKAIQAGADGSEFDVYTCGDGAVVLMHDDTVDRTTNGKGKVTELGLADLKKLDAGSWKHRRYAGERVPTLTEALERLKGSGCRAVVEIKMEGIAGKVVDEIRACGMLDQAVVIAFSANVVREVRTREPRLPCAWLCGEELEGTAAERADWILAQAEGCKTDLVDLHYQMLSPELIAELHRRGLKVWTWTVDDPKVMDALIRWNVDSITTDWPNLLDASRPR